MFKEYFYNWGIKAKEMMYMEHISTAIEIGQRCRKFRNALGLSQQGLADKIGTTPQNISKYEKDGIYNIEVIQEISKALGHDLLTDEIDTEGTVGEIGREILLILINGNGYVDSSDILNGKQLYGLTEERCTKELFKLEKIGLCVREQYTDFYDKKQDKIFITAKGIITLKHIEPTQSLGGDFENVSSYEKICKWETCYQELLDSHLSISTKKIRDLKPVKGFRISFIKYLRDEYWLGNFGNNDYLDELEDNLFKGMDPGIIPGTNAYFDILFSMVLGFSRKDVDFLMECIESEENHEFEEADSLNSELYPDEEIKNRFLWRFKDRVPVAKTMLPNCVADEKLNSQLSIEEVEEKQARWEELDDKFDEQDAFYSKLDLNTRYLEACEKYESKNPLDWFCKEEIEIYIKENILPPTNEEEKKLEEQLIQIMQMEPGIVTGYFKFTSEWEENGLADLVRSLYKVPTIE
jgi:transcriptional regulator with XRE-family HTH domain/RNA binding exosome subunit